MREDKREVVRLLLQHGADPNRADPETGRTAMDIAQAKVWGWATLSEPRWVAMHAEVGGMSGGACKGLGGIAKGMEGAVDCNRHLPHNRGVIGALGISVKCSLLLSAEPVLCDNCKTMSLVYFHLLSCRCCQRSTLFSCRLVFAPHHTL